MSGMSTRRWSLLVLAPLFAACGDDGAAMPDAAPEKFSFFVTSLQTMRTQSGSQDGFGGDLGGLAGADAICQKAAADAGAGGKTWRAFLSTTAGPVHAIDRVGSGPWYDRNGRLIANDRAGLLMLRPAGDTVAVNDMADETGAGTRSFGDTHDIMTGTNAQGMLESSDPASTCNDWTSAVGPGSENKVRAGHSWPAMSGMNWMMAHRLPGCAPGVRLTITPPGQEGNTVGGQGGWGGIYCFALTP